jgi:hypothetical protein
MKYKYIRHCVNLLLNRVIVGKNRPPPPTHKGIIYSGYFIQDVKKTGERILGSLH